LNGSRGRSPHLLVFALLILAATAIGLRAFGQARYLQRYQEPEWSRFRITDISVGGYAEGTFDQNDFKNSGTTVTHERVFVGPALGLNAVGSIYHPNLLTYYLNSDEALTDCGPMQQWNMEPPYVGCYTAY